MLESEKNMIRYDQARLKAEEDLNKVNKKLEAEIKLRILFEQKINHLHFLNETASSKMRLQEEQIKISDQENTRLSQENKNFRKQLTDLSIYKSEASNQLTEY